MKAGKDGNAYTFTPIRGLRAEPRVDSPTHAS